MKKACLTMRQRQMDELSKKGNLPVSMLGHLSPSGELPPARAKAVAPARKAMKKAPEASARAAEKAGRGAGPKHLDLFTQEIKVRGLAAVMVVSWMLILIDFFMQVAVW